MLDRFHDRPLDAKGVDYVVVAAKAALGRIPFVGSLLVEVAGAVIPNQRLDRIARFAEALERRLGALERERAAASLTDEEFTDLIEEGLRQAARSTTDERREYIASVIANSLSSEALEFQESKHLLRLLGEMNDAEVIWLRFYLAPTISGDQEFRQKHKAVIAPVTKENGSPPAVRDKAALQRSYKLHLAQMGLLEPRYKTDMRTKEPVFDSSNGLKVDGYRLTRLGDLMLRYLGLAAEPEPR